jgi:hypothetical protein
VEPEAVRRTRRVDRWCGAYGVVGNGFGWRGGDDNWVEEVTASSKCREVNAEKELDGHKWVGRWCGACGVVGEGFRERTTGLKRSLQAENAEEWTQKEVRRTQ